MAGPRGGFAPSNDPGCPGIADEQPRLARLRLERLSAWWRGERDRFVLREMISYSAIAPSHFFAISSSNNFYRRRCRIAHLAFDPPYDGATRQGGCDAIPASDLRQREELGQRERRGEGARFRRDGAGRRRPFQAWQDARWQRPATFVNGNDR